MTTNLHPCLFGHDWQSVERAMTGTGVLIVCRRCAASEWVGAEPEAIPGPDQDPKPSPA